jgi:hypothetical protein
MRAPVAIEAKAQARNKLMASVSAGHGKEEAVFGMFKFAHVIGAVVAALGLMTAGVMAAAGGPDKFIPFVGDHDVVTSEFKGEVIESGDQHLAIKSGEKTVSFVVTGETVFKNAAGQEIDGVEQGDMVIVVAKKDGDHLVALKVRIVAEDVVIKPSHTPEPTKAPDIHEPTATPKPAPTEKPAPPAAPTEAVYEGYVKEVGDGFFVLKLPDYTKLTIHVDSHTVLDGSLVVGCNARAEAMVYGDGSIVARKVTCPVAPMEFWGVVVAMGDGHMVLNTEFGQATVFWGPETYWSGEPFVGVKVTVRATKNADGTFLASKIIVKASEISGTIASVGSGSMTVNSSGSMFTVTWNGSTVWQGPDPYVGAPVWAAVYKMGDGTYLASKIVVKAPSFTGTVTAHMPEQFTIHVLVEGVTKVVCYQFADVVGTLDVGKTVYVEVDHEEGGTYFAALVKVIA